jgi:ABC-type multidrug transport system fused ATPase/permease subunit
MFIFAFVISLALIAYGINKANKAEDNESTLNFNGSQNIIIVGLLGVGILLEVLTNILNEVLTNYYWPMLGIYTVICLSVFVVLNKIREKQIKEEHDQITLIFEALSKILGKQKEIDFNDLPFSYEGENGKIQKIIIDMKDPDKFSDPVVTSGVFSLNKFFPYYQWISNVNFPKRECIFQGQKLPPDIAMWPGSDLRPAGWIPLGVAGSGEAGWNIANPKDLGVSSYIRDGERIGTVKSSSAPQGLCVGSTGGGKSIWIEQEVQVLT